MKIKDKISKTISDIRVNLGEFEAEINQGLDNISDIINDEVKQLSKIVEQGPLQINYNTNKLNDVISNLDSSNLGGIGGIIQGLLTINEEYKVIKENIGMFNNSIAKNYNSKIKKAINKITHEVEDKVSNTVSKVKFDIEDIGILINGAKGQLIDMMTITNCSAEDKICDINTVIERLTKIYSTIDELRTHCEEHKEVIDYMKNLISVIPSNAPFYSPLLTKLDDFINIFIGNVKNINNTSEKKDYVEMHCLKLEDSHDIHIMGLSNEGEN